MKSAQKEALLWVGQEALGLGCSALRIMGYYPMIPAYYAAQMWGRQIGVRGKERTKWNRMHKITGVGTIIGTLIFPNMEEAVRYLTIMVTLAVLLRFYVWANRSCSGLAAGIMSGALVATVSVCGCLLMPGSTLAMWEGVFEGVFAVGATWFLTRLWRAGCVIPDKLQAARMRMPKERTSSQGCGNAMEYRASEGSLGTMVDAIRGITMIMGHKGVEDGTLDLTCGGGAGACAMQIDQAWQRKMGENRRMLIHQMNAITDFLSKSRNDQEQGNANAWMQGRIRRMIYESAERGICMEQVEIREAPGGRIRVSAMVSAKWKGSIPTEKYKHALEKSLRRSMRLEQDAPELLTAEPREISCYEDTHFYVLSGAASSKKEGAAVSGDSYDTWQSDNGIFFGAISDGMGSGAQAREESTMMLDVLRKLLIAGIGEEQAIQMLDAALSTSQQAERFSTLDILSIDMYSGMAHIRKAGAPVSFMKRKGQVQLITQNSLPLGGRGLLSAGRTEMLELEHGDLLVMLTDGVLEYLKTEEPEKKIAEMLEELDTENAGALALGLLERVMSSEKHQKQDDMTVLVFGIWEK